LFGKSLCLGQGICNRLTYTLGELQWRRELCSSWPTDAGLYRDCCGCCGFDSKALVVGQSCAELETGGLFHHRRWNKRCQADWHGNAHKKLDSAGYCHVERGRGNGIDLSAHAGNECVERNLQRRHQISRSDLGGIQTNDFDGL